MTDFKVGDYVEIKYSGSCLNGLTGIIKRLPIENGSRSSYNYNDTKYAIEFPDIVKNGSSIIGNNCDGHCKERQGYYVNFKNLILIKKKITNWKDELK